MTRVDVARAALLASTPTAPYDTARVLEAFTLDLDPPPPSYVAADVRVLCPRGHFIAAVTVLAADAWPGITVLPKPRPERESPVHGLAYEEPRNWTSGHLDQLLHGRIRAACKRSACRYRGSIASDMLAVELAEAAVQSRREHRLTM